MAALGGKVRARIIWPRNGALISGEQTVYGTAFSRDFSHYTLAYAPSDDPENYTMIGEYHQRVLIGLLGRWDTSTVEDGKYILKLTVQAGDGRTADDTKDVGVDNNPPAVSISTPPDGGVVESPFEVTGTATDAFLHDWRLTRDSNSPMLLAHLDGSTVNERDAEEGEVTGEPDYQEAKFAQGLHLGQGEGLTYPSRKNINKDAGTIEMWVIPGWEEEDTDTHILLHTETADPLTPTDCLRIAAEAGNLTFTVYDSGGTPLTSSVPLADAGVLAGTPFHLGAAWSEGTLSLAVNGFSAGDPQGTGTGALSTLGRKIHLGFHPGVDTYAEATIDELSIYNHPRPLTSIRTDFLADAPKDMGSGKELVSQGKDPVVESLLGTVEVPDLPGESLTLTLTARDRKRKRSETSATVFMDNPSPYALITSPSEGAELEGQVEVTGYAFDMDLSTRTLSYREGTDPQAPGEWTQVHTAGEPAWGSTLGTWDTTTVENGDYLLRLVVTDNHGKVTEAFQPVSVANVPSLTLIEVAPSEVSLNPNETVQFTATGYDQNDEEMEITPVWAVENPDIGQIDQNGLFTAIETGNTKVTASAGEITGEATVEVVPELASIEVPPAFAVLDHGQSVGFTATGYNDQGEEVPIDPQEIQWSCDPLSGEIDTSGLFTATGCGTTDITANALGVEGTATAQVMTYIGGTLSGNRTLEKRCNPYILRGTLTVGTGGVLTIGPGVVIKAEDGASIYLTGAGIINSNGVEGDPVHITSIADDSVCGDTNEDGSSEGSRGDWQGIQIMRASLESTFNHTNVSCAVAGIGIERGASQQASNCEFTRSSYGISVGRYGSISVDNCRIEDVAEGICLGNSGATATVTGSHIRNADNTGIAVNGSPYSGQREPVLNLDNSTIEDCNWGITARSNNSPELTVTDNTINNCTTGAVSLGFANPNNVSGNTGSGNGINGIVVNGSYSHEYVPEELVWNATNENLPYVIISSDHPDHLYEGITVGTLVGSDITLTIEAGTVVKSYELVGITLNDYGVLDVQAPTPENPDPVVFTSVDDDSFGGDTLNDGQVAEEDIRQWGAWGGIYMKGFYAHGTRINGAVIKYASIGVNARGTGHRIIGCSFENVGTGVTSNRGDTLIDDCTFENVGTGLHFNKEECTGTVSNCHIANASSCGVYVSGRYPTITNNLIENCGSGIYVESGSIDELEPTITDNEINNCADTAISLRCYSPNNVSGNLGSGNGINGIVVGGDCRGDSTWHPNGFPFVLALSEAHGGHLRMGEHSLTIQAGVVVKGDAGRGITADNGSIHCQGEEGNPVTFTSVHDEMGGQETYRDDPHDNSYHGDWSEISVSGDSCSFTYTNISYGGGNSVFSRGAGISFSGDAGMVVTDCTISNMSRGGINADTKGTVDIRRNTVDDCGGSGIRIGNCGLPSTVASNTVNDCAEFLGMISGGLENLEIRDNGGTGNEINGIEVDYNWSIVHHFIFWRNDVPYTLTRRDIALGEGTALTVKPGVAIKCRSHGIKVVGGSLYAEGVPGQEIVMTSVNDPRGGNTINDGLTHCPSYNDWTGIEIREDAQASIDNVYLGFGGASRGLIHCKDNTPALGAIEIVNGSFYSEEIHLQGGVGIALEGNCPISISGCEISYCDAAVSCDYTHSPDDQECPSINNSFLYDNHYGLKVEGTHDLGEYIAKGKIVDAQDNWWRLSRGEYNDLNGNGQEWKHLENGPRPAGDGSGINNFDAVDVLPWQGLGQNHEQDNDMDETKPEVGIVYSYSETEPIQDAEYACDNFANVCAADGITVRQIKGNTDQGDVLRSGERDMRDYFVEPHDPKTDGHDPLSFDNVDLGMFAGHGTIRSDGDQVTSRMLFASERNDGTLFSSEIAWGDQDLEWAIVYSCRFFARNDQVDTIKVDRGHKPGVPPEDELYNEDDYSILEDVHNRLHAQTIDKGLHMVMGFGTREYMKGEMGQETAELMTQPSDTKRIRIAWFTAAYHNQPQDNRNEDQLWDAKSIWDPDNLAVAYGASGYMDDFFWGKGPVAPTDPGPGATPVFKTQVCDYEEGPELPEGELPEQNITNIVDPLSTYEADPGEPMYFTLYPSGDTKTFDANGIIVRFRAVDAQGLKQYVQTNAAYEDDYTVYVIVPSTLERGKDYQVLFLNQNMAFGYLEQNLHIREE